MVSTWKPRGRQNAIHYHIKKCFFNSDKSVFSLFVVSGNLIYLHMYARTHAHTRILSLERFCLPPFHVLKNIAFQKS